MYKFLDACLVSMVTALPRRALPRRLRTPRFFLEFFSANPFLFPFFFHHFFFQIKSATLVPLLFSNRYSNSSLLGEIGGKYNNKQMVKFTTTILGLPRIGVERELKWALEKYWRNAITEEELITVGKGVRRANWEVQMQKQIDLIPSNDFSFYDQVLDTSVLVGAVPERYKDLLTVSTSEHI